MSYIEYNLPKNAYATFDAVSFRDLINERLTEGGVFTDQIYAGSNINALNEMLAVAFHVLMFYLNQTASETKFSQAQLYENMNELVKLIQYNPRGYQTAVIPFNARSTLPSGSYYIPRYSYINLGGINYSFTKDVFFNKSPDSNILQELEDDYLLYQGIFKLFPVYTARGNEYETLAISQLTPNKEPLLIDHDNIHVYVKEVNSDKWYQWQPCNSLFLEQSNSRSYEIRFGERKIYDIKFGNGIFGRKLTEGDEIAIYYLESKGVSGEVTADGSFKGVNVFQTTLYKEIMTDVVTNSSIPVITPSNGKNIEIQLTGTSSNFKSYETVEEIRNNAPQLLYSKQQLVTLKDFDVFIKRNFNNFLLNSTVANNDQYVNEYIKYFTDIGYYSDKKDAKALMSYVRFGHQSQFNNVYVVGVPYGEDTNNFGELQNSQKQYIINALKDVQLLSLSPYVLDPHYSYINIASQLDLFGTTQNEYLWITKQTDNITDNEMITWIQAIFDGYFKEIASLGCQIQASEIYNRILNLGNVKQVRTGPSQSSSVEGVSLILYSNVYPSDRQIVNQQLKLPFFKYPIWRTNLKERIKIS